MMLVPRRRRERVGGGYSRAVGRVKNLAGVCAAVLRPRQLAGGRILPLRCHVFTSDHEAEMMKEYDFSRGIRGKVARRFAPGSRAIVLDPDVARVFPDSKSVNEVFRALAPVLRRRRRKAS
jgi:hypothetical protein